MPQEPPVKRAIAFYDGQNLFRHAMAAFGHYHPNYDPWKLFEAVCESEAWTNNGVRFYTGTPLAEKDPMWHRYWNKRLLAMRRGGILVTSRPIRYHQIETNLADGTVETVESAHEKGIDVRLALDVVRLARTNQLDVAVIFSQDQDLAEVAEEIRDIARSEQRWIKIVSAFPSGPNASANRGINGTDWFRIDEALYNACLDPRDYR